MPSRRRKVRNVEQRRKMKLHNRRDDIPDCETLEIIEFDENCADPSFAELHSDSDSTDEKECKTLRTRSFKTPLLHDPETRVSFTDANNNDNYKDIKDRSFKSCVALSSSASRAASTARSKSDGASSAASTETRRKRRHRSKSRRHEKPSFLMKFAKSFLENLGQAITDFFMFLCSLLKIDAGNRTTPAGCFLLLVGTYFFISYIEVSFAGMIEILFEWLWPSIHISLRMIERFFKGIGNAFAGLDDLAESSYCDMASMWCDFFSLMCSSRCSFTKFALERIRE
uniref:Uncharacterized protein n=1 Tax=Panagrolaimus superbus TaxID=310955 RepID=A0A914Y971_9BILA